MFRISWSVALSLLLAWLNNRRLSGVWVLCQVDLAFRFAATSLLILLDMLLVGRWRFLAGVAVVGVGSRLLQQLSRVEVLSLLWM